jgi:hypothetical protein
MNTGLLEALYVCVVAALHQYEENIRTTVYVNNSLILEKS